MSVLSGNDNVLETEEAVRATLDSWAKAGLSILDTRHSDDFTAHHLPRSLNIPWESSKQRLFELPPREVPFGVVTYAATRADVQACLASGRWSVSHAFVDSDVLWSVAEQIGLVERGPSRHIMFLPCQFFAEVFPRIDAELSGRGSAIRMCDVGCGSGRDTVYAGLRGWHVTALDNLPAAVVRVDAIANRLGLVNVAGCVLDVTDTPALQRFVAEEGPFDVVVCVRFLQRECFDLLAQLVAPGGFLVYQHFRDGVQHSRVGRPNHPKHILEDRELHTVFVQRHGMVCVLDRDDWLDDERPVNNFLAQRPLPDHG